MIKKQRWIKKGAPVLVDGKPGNIYKVIYSAFDGRDADVYKISVKLEGSAAAVQYDPSVVVRRTETSVYEGNDVININTLKAKTYDLLALDPEYLEALGEMESRFVGMAYGPSASGKSVWTLKFANHYAGKVGKVLYNMHEEGFNKTCQDRANKFNIGHKNLFVGNRLSFAKMVAKIKANHYRLVIVDSVQRMGFTFDQLVELQTIFKKRKLAIMMVSFGTDLGKTDRANDLLHEADIKILIKNGQMTVMSRYLDQPYHKTLFTPKSAKKSIQPSLFKQYESQSNTQ